MHFYMFGKWSITKFFMQVVYYDSFKWMCIPKDASKEIMAKMCFKAKKNIIFFGKYSLYYDFSCKLSIVNFRYNNYFLIITISWQLLHSSSANSESLAQKLRFIAIVSYKSTLRRHFSKMVAKYQGSGNATKSKCN